jgi:hypothetical protein
MSRLVNTARWAAVLLVVFVVAFAATKILLLR